MREIKHKRLILFNFKKYFNNTFILYSVSTICIILIVLSILKNPDQNIPAHPDEPNVVETAIRISDGSFNPEFFRYPSGHMNILAIIYKVSGYFNPEQTKEDYYFIARAFSRLCIAGISAMVFIICSMNMSSYFSILASVLTIFSITLYTNANFVLVDIPMALFITLFFFIVTTLYSNNVWQLKYIILLAFITGVAISMKYTAALLIPSLIFVSVEYVHKQKKNIIPIIQLKKGLLIIGNSLFIISIITIIMQEALLEYFTGFTTDGILEIEYIRTLSNFSSLIMIAGILLIIFSLRDKLVKNEWVGFIFSPFHIFTIFILIIGFAIFSPFTLIEYKKSFADFMYEYRHMKIGSAAQYHHLSDEYKNIISNLSSTASGIFYMNLIYRNLGIIGIIISIYGFYHMYLRNPAYSITILIYLVLLLFTLLTWKNYAVRYAFSIFPIMIVFITHGLLIIYQKLSQKYSYRYSIAIFLYIIVLIHPISNLINQ